MSGSYSLTLKLLSPLEEFFSTRKPSLKVLLGLSGGPDSMALFYALLKIREKYPFELGVAHVDHRWREESRDEAEFLKELTERYSVPFHLAVLDPAKLEGNLEEACRKCRYAFFQEIAKKEAYQCLFLGHHQGDQVETVLKRIFEGAHFNAMQGMRGETLVGKLLLVRPWLKVPKETILDFVKAEKIPFFDDPTNRDKKFLRGKMRTEILPFLERTFAKNIASNLSHFSAEMAQLDSFMEERTAQLFKQIVSGPFGWLLINTPLHPFEVKYFLKKWFKEQKEEISRQAIDQVAALYCDHSANKFVETASYNVAVDRGRVFVLLKGYDTHKLEDWKPASLFNEWEPGWEAVFCGCAFFSISEEKVEVVEFNAIPPSSEKRKLAKKLAEQGIPLFLRNLAPFLLGADGKLFDPFLKKGDFSSLRLKSALLKLEK